jgi:hypothetical protein
LLSVRSVRFDTWFITGGLPIIAAGQSIRHASFGGSVAGAPGSVNVAR